MNFILKNSHLLNLLAIMLCSMSLVLSVLTGAAGFAILDFLFLIANSYLLIWKFDHLTKQLEQNNGQ